MTILSDDGDCWTSFIQKKNCSLQLKLSTSYHWYSLCMIIIIIIIITIILIFCGKKKSHRMMIMKLDFSHNYLQVVDTRKANE